MSMEMRFIYNSDDALLQNNETAEISFVHLMFSGISFANSSGIDLT